MLCNGPLKHGASLFIEAVGAGNYGRGSLEPHSGHLAWLGLEPSPRIFLSWTKPSTYQAFPLSSRLIPLQLAPTIPFSSVHTSSYSFQLPASCSYSFQLPAHTASSFQLIQLPASSIKITMRINRSVNLQVTWAECWQRLNTLHGKFNNSVGFLLVF